MQLVLQFLLLFLIFQTSYFLMCNAIECTTNSQDPSKVTSTITVSKSGGANFTTVTDALNSIPSGNNQWIKISLDPGTYKEQISIPAEKQCIFLEGQDRATTTIVFDAHSSTSQPTITVLADNFVAKGVTFMNSYNLPVGNNHNPIDQALAFAARGDKQAFFSCGFEGYQDTLWDDKGRHYFSSCYLEGAIDFIYGAGQSVYEQCAINVTGAGTITAQGRASADDMDGFVFRQCNVSGKGHGCLGRAYKEHARVIFIESTFDYDVAPEGWNIWKQSGHEQDITFAEINCTGKGADDSKRVPWMKKTLPGNEIESFSTKAFVDQEGWIAKLPLPNTQDYFANKRSFNMPRKGRFY